MTKFQVFFFLFFPLLACSQNTTKQTSDAKTSTINGIWKTFDQPNYSILYPSSWNLNLNGQMGMSFIILSPRESEQDKFSENVNLVIQDMTGKDIDLDKYSKISVEQIKTMLTNSVIIESKSFKKGNAEYRKFIYTADQGIFHLKTEQYYWVMKEKAYVLTFTSEQNKYADYVEVGEKIMNSFIIK